MVAACPEDGHVSMLKERRKHQRLVINRVTTFRAPSGLPRECLITNISCEGARRFSEGAEVPDQFDLVIADDLARRCQVMWRLGGEIGVKFMDGSVPIGRAFER
jgi:hypothetical protein